MRFAVFLGGSLAAGARIMPHLPSHVETIRGIKCFGTVEHGHVRTGILAERRSVTALPLHFFVFHGISPRSGGGWLTGAAALQQEDDSKERTPLWCGSDEREARHFPAPTDISYSYYTDFACGSRETPASHAAGKRLAQPKHHFVPGFDPPLRRKV